MEERKRLFKIYSSESRSTEQEIQKVLDDGFCIKHMDFQTYKASDATISHVIAIYFEKLLLSDEDFDARIEEKQDINEQLIAITNLQ